MAADTAAGRIMELSKKNRELTADLESERNKVRQLTKKARDMEREVATMTLNRLQARPFTCTLHVEKTSHSLGRGKDHSPTSSTLWQPTFPAFPYKT